MKIASVRIENFRSFADVTIPFNDYACLVGPNGAGKSTIIIALNVFFQEFENASTNLSQLDREDFHCKNTAKPIRITLTFNNLNDEARQDFSDYVRHDQLVVSAIAEYDEATGSAKVEQYGQRLGIPDFAKFFDLQKGGRRVDELKSLYTELQGQFTGLPSAKTRDAMVLALRTYETEHRDQCELILSEDQFYGFSKGKNRLAKHIQWVYIPAVKDPTSEQIEARNSALGKLLSRTVRSKSKFETTVQTLRGEMQRQYQELLDGSQDVLNEISNSLQQRLSEWAHPDARLRLQWKQDPEKSVRVEEPWAHIIVGESDFEGELARFGHGLQRSYLLALLQELAGSDIASSPTLILACEEPELYQHPPQARHLATVLQRLSRTNCQVIVSTHDPFFVSGEGFEDVRMVRKAYGSPRSFVSHMAFTDIAQTIGDTTGRRHNKPEGVLAKIHQALQPSLNEMFFVRRLILVEGLEDLAYLTTYLNLQDQYDEYRRWAVISCLRTERANCFNLLSSLSI